MYFKQLKPDFVCVRQGKGDVLNMMSCQEELCEGNPKSRHHWKDYLSKKCESAHKSKNQGKAPTTGCTLAFQWEVCQRRKLYLYTSWHRSFQLSQELFNLPYATTIIFNFRLFFTILYHTKPVSMSLLGPAKSVEKRWPKPDRQFKSWRFWPFSPYHTIPYHAKPVSMS